MTRLPDLFPGFKARTLPGNGVNIFCRISPSSPHKPPLLLLHGYPQSHVMWHKVAPSLAEEFNVVVMDSRGAGQSDAPIPDDTHQLYSKRTMARDAVQLMEALGYEHFMIVGHDRGARVGYRLAFDFPEKVKALVVLDIIPTNAMWANYDHVRAMQVYHWTFLSQPAPLPETLIAGNSDYFLEYTLASWSAQKDLSPFSPQALEHYRANFRKPERIAASCADYRAGYFTDRLLDEEELMRGNKIQAPVAAFWGESGIPSKGESPLAQWQEYCHNVTGEPIQCGHFIPEENPQNLLEKLYPFLRKHI